MIAGFQTHRGQLTSGARFLGGLAVCLLLLLMTGSASPEVHDHLCAQAHQTADADHCAFVAFAAGETGAPLPVFRVEPRVLRLESILAAEQTQTWLEAGHRLQPACGPPVTGPAFC